MSRTLLSYASLQPGSGLLEGHGQPTHDLLDFLLRDDEGGSHHDQVAVRAVGLADVGPDGQPRGERRVRKSLREFYRPRERDPSRLVFHEFDAGEEAAAAHVPDV